MIKFKNKGTFDNLTKFLKKIKQKSNIDPQITQFAEICLDELKDATPVDTGLTAKSWNYEIVKSGHKTTVTFNNTNIQNGMNIAILISFGHGTSNGAWIEGVDYIDPIVKRNYLNLVNNCWKEMVKA